MMTPVISVALGGAFGAVARYMTGQAVVRFFGVGFPFGTLTVNIIGSLAMGMAFVLLGQNAKMSPLLMTGFLGGFTTFSAFSLDAYNLYERGETSLAIVYVTASVVMSIAALVAGIAIARGLSA
ncbi:MAG: fluoride efflux transporter CrcB [Paracoccaceae bacterium]|nr:fluoride efflux transporter CrcB [Paracoccaceae bacterium]MDG2260501.1 fluoride efflux transporter CrcB [Paracoccaceae bacterium]